MLRECARILSEDRKRVVIVDTSNEIAGDSDIPHPGIGFARRMQVADPALQHAVMIEAVENHMPEVIVIDEIGTEAEAGAARTIAERGVTLIGTAHGQTLENLLMNPTLSDLVGGISAVTLSDEEARRRGTRKTVLERKAPPTFDVVVEIHDRDRLAIHKNVAEVVDALLRGYQPQPEIRQRAAQRRGDGRARGRHRVHAAARRELRHHAEARESEERDRPLLIFPYGVSRNKIERAIHNLRVNAAIARNWDDADVVHRRSRRSNARRSRNSSKSRPTTCRSTRSRPTRRRRFKQPCATCSTWGRSTTKNSPLREAEEAIYQVLLTSQAIELSPQTSYVRRMQHQLAEKYRLQSRSTGLEPNRRVRIFKTTSD